MAWYDVLTDFGTMMAETIFGLASVIIYPFIQILNEFMVILDAFYQALYSMIHLILAIFDSTVNTVFFALTALFPSMIVAIFLLLFGILVLLFIYKKVRGVSIFGWSLGGG